MDPITTFSGTMAALPINDIDTDQIIPARFLKTTDKAGLGQQAFFDWRYEADGSPKADFVLNRPERAGASVLVAGDNFGCGSSREHAPWALLGAGIKAVVSTDFADIFRSNALKNGLLPIVIDAETHAALMQTAESDPDAQVTVDLAAQTLTLPDGGTVSFPIDGFAKTCLLEGVDQLGYLLNLDAATRAYEDSHPARVDTLHPVHTEAAP